MNKKRLLPSIFATNVFYLIIAIVLLTLGSFVQRREIYSGLLITQYLIILLPTILYLKTKGYNIKSVLRLNRITFKQAFLIPFIVIMSYPIGAFFNSIMMVIISVFGEVYPPPLPVPGNEGELWIGLLIIAVSPGICEEAMFRGMVMKAYERYSVKKAIIISGVLFGIFHFNIQNLLGPIFLGILFAYLVYKTNSLLSSIIAHTTNNAIAWVLSYFIGDMAMQQQTNQIVEQMSHTKTLALGSLYIGIIALITGSGAYQLIKKLPSSEKSLLLDKNCTHKFEKKLNNKDIFIEFLPLLFILIIFIYLSIKIIV